MLTNNANATKGRRLLACTALLAFAVAVAAALACAVGFAPSRAFAATGALQAQGTGYEIVYKLNGGVQKDGQTLYVAPGKTISVSKLKKPTRTGYKFKGWFKNAKLTKKASVVKGVKKVSKRRLYAKWAPRTYRIAYKLNGGKLKGSYPTSYTYAKGTALPTPTRKGYTFAGWYSNKALTKAVTEISTTNYGKKTLYAKWTPKRYKIVYTLNGGSLEGASAPATYTIEDAVKLPEPKRAGYSFIGWYTDEALASPIDAIEAGTTGKKKLYARWQERILIAHRGYHAAEAKNSLGAYIAAKEKGFTYVETDVRFTSDDVAVLVHDATVPLQVVGKDGGTVTVKVAVADLTYEQLQSCQLNTTASGVDGANVTTFDDFIATCAELGLHPNIELKAGTEAQVKQLIQTVERYGIADDVKWTSFKTDIVGYVNKLRPKATLGVLAYNLTKTHVTKALAFSKSGAYVTLSARASTLTDAMVKLAKDARLPLGVWTLSDETQIADLDPYLFAFTIDGLVAETVPEVI